jgi:ribosomal protein S12 methylthiotransferase accessory factor
VPAKYAAHLRELRRARSTVHLLDATTDFGVPTVYAVEERPREQRVRHVVGCATSPSPHDAWTGALKELVAVSCLLLRENAPPPPAGVDEVIELENGAVFMARAERSQAFDFLKASTASTRIDSLASTSHLSPREQFADLIDRFAARGMDLLILDITPADVREHGLSVMRAIAPDLMPLPTMFRSRYLGHRRLYDYARNAGLVDFSEALVNPHPQPFA